MSGTSAVDEESVESDSLPFQLPKRTSLFVLMAKRKRRREKPLARIVKGNRRNMKSEEKETDKQRAWSELPMELLELILSHFDLRENVLFSAICKRWHSIALSVRVVNQCPLLFYTGKTGICEFYDPSNRKTYIIEYPELSGARICCSKDGWLLVHTGIREMFFFNPFTNDRIELPKYRLKRDNTAAFSSAPTSPSCMVFTLKDYGSMLLVSTCRPGETVWTNAYYEPELPSFDFKSLNPIFCGGLVYTYSSMDRVAVLNLQERTWRVLDVSPPPGPSNLVMAKVMADFKGDLLMVCICYNKEAFVLKLDQVNMEWVKMNSFDGLTLFASFLSSHMTENVPKIMRNSVYFPKLRIFGKRCISYSLDDRRYYPGRYWHDWGGQGPFGHQMELGIWIEPPRMFQPPSDEL